MYLSQINIYPIKSLRGISVSEAVVEDRGLQFDRRWMLVDETNTFITQREVPRMATVAVEVGVDELIVTANGSDLHIPFQPFQAADGSGTVKIWNSSVEGEFYDDETDQWFSDALGTKCRLVLMPEETKRKVSPFHAVKKYKDIVSFADGYPFLLIGEASLADLNSRLTSPVPMNRFRPNLVVADAEPFEEDTWRRIKIGETIFHIVKPCARCVLTTVDQAKGEKTGKEPLQTLAAYRTKNGKVLFGQNLIAEEAGGAIRVGDKVEVIETK